MDGAFCGTEVSKELVVRGRCGSFQRALRDHSASTEFRADPAQFLLLPSPLL
jgi:hypothetical protein